MYVEDVRSITIDVIELIEKELSKFNITMSDKNLDEINEFVWNKLEEVCPNDYKHHN